MSEEVSIKVNVADRVFPLTVNIDEEEKIRKAAKLINNKIQYYKESFEIKDKDVLLSMVGLELATEAVEFQSKKWIEDNGISDKINEIEALLKEL